MEFQICLAAGKANSKGKLKKHYRRLLKRGRKAADSLTGELSHLEEGLSMETLPPISPGASEAGIEPDQARYCRRQAGC